MESIRLGRAQRRRSRPGRACEHAERAGPGWRSSRGDRTDNFRQGCVVHGERAELALLADDRGSVSGCHRRAGGAGNLRKAFITSLVELAERDPRVVLLTGDLGFTVIEDFAERFPDRFVNVGVAEQNMLGVATCLLYTSPSP